MMTQDNQLASEYIHYVPAEKVGIYKQMIKCG
ncbi:hypothetical protein LCGC14_0233350 [marine sediment metagenome]|uniref:Uncharacterized protein n=1 Tax=marine sediment metagenome TaxID=412755 RepID=A0A0F9UR37_9ZZZZ